MKTNEDKFFEDNERFADRHKGKNKQQREIYATYRALLWRAIDEKDKNFSIVETAIALGLHERKS